MRRSTRSEAGRDLVLARYRELLARWPAGTRQLRVHTREGETLVVACGPADAPLRHRPGEPMPAGIEAVPTARAAEVVYVVASHVAVVPGDVILGAKDGPGLRLCPAGWLPDGVGLDDLRSSLLPLLDRPVERVMVSHGEPVLENAHAELSRLLGA